MISEYALEPKELLANLDQKYFFRESFGSRTGRILSQYPKKWGRLVWKEFEASEFSSSVQRRIGLEEILAGKMLAQSVKRPLSVEAQEDWLAQAELEHEKGAFRAILASDNPRGHADVLGVQNLLDDEDERWVCPVSCRVPRRADDIVRAVAPLLLCSREVLLIDPHFSVERHCTAVLRAMATTLWSDSALCSTPKLCVLTTFTDARGKPLEGDALENRVAAYQDAANRHVLPFVPVGRNIQFAVCMARPNGQSFHDRFLLTDVASVNFGHGLCQNRREDDQNEVNLTLLDSEATDQLWRDFVSGSPTAYDVVASFSVGI